MVSKKRSEAITLKTKGVQKGVAKKGVGSNNFVNNWIRPRYYFQIFYFPARNSEKRRPCIGVQDFCGSKSWIDMNSAAMLSMEAPY